MLRTWWAWFKPDNTTESSLERVDISMKKLAFGIALTLCLIAGGCLWEAGSVRPKYVHHVRDSGAYITELSIDRSTGKILSWKLYDEFTGNIIASADMR